MSLMLLFLAHAVLAGIAALLANRKQRNAVGWGTVTLLFGLIPLIVLLLVPKGVAR
jgi:hypothetical protein